jgi:hypothetical protein
MKKAATKNSGAKPLAELVEPFLQPIMAAQGFASVDLVSGWPELIGSPLDAHTQPVKLEWPRRQRAGEAGLEGAGATLVLRVESAFALDVQHQLPVLIERINSRYGWRCVEKIVLKQGPVEHKARVKPVARPTAETIEAAEMRVGAVADSGLREALVRLGAGVMSAERAGKPR